MRAGRHRVRHARAERREKAVGRRDTQCPLKRRQRNIDVGRELALHRRQVEIDVFDLSLREILRQQPGTQRGRVVEHRAPIHRMQSLVADLDHIARLGVLDGNRADDRMRPAPGIAGAQLCKPADRHPGLQLVQKMRPGVRKADRIAGIDRQNRRQGRIEHPEPHRLLVRVDDMDAAAGTHRSWPVAVSPAPAA